MDNYFPFADEPVGLYLRASGDPRRDRASVTDQRAYGVNWVKQVRASIFDVYEDNAESASVLYEEGRQDFARLIEAIRKRQITLLWMWTLSRSQRRLQTFAELRDVSWRSGVKWVIKDRVYDLGDRGDRMALGFQALQDEDLPLQISANTVLGLAGRAARGLPPSTVLYGYRRLFDPDTGQFRAQVIDRARSEIVREAADRLVAGETSHEIAKTLNDRGIPTALNKRWTNLTIRQMLLNAAYIGKRLHHGEVVADGQWEPILKEDVYYACRAILLDSSRRTTPGVKLKYLLSGIAVCGKEGCGGRVYPGKIKGGLSYICKTSFCVSRRMVMVDEYVMEVVLETLSRPDAEELFTQQPADSRVDGMRSQLLRRQSDLTDWKAAATAGKVKPLEYAEITAPIRQDIEALEKQLRQLTRHPVLADAAMPGIRDRWPAFSLTRRRDIIRAMFRIELLPPGRGRWRSLDPATIIITPLWDGTAD